MLKHRVQKSWPQSSAMGSRSLSRQMQQAGSSRGAAGRDPRLSSNLGNGVWDLGAEWALGAASGVQGTQARDLVGRSGGPREATLTCTPEPRDPRVISNRSKLGWNPSSTAPYHRRQAPAPIWVAFLIVRGEEISRSLPHRVIKEDGAVHSPCPVPGTKCS